MPSIIYLKQEIPAYGGSIRVREGAEEIAVRLDTAPERGDQNIKINISGRDAFVPVDMVGLVVDGRS